MWPVRWVPSTSRISACSGSLPWRGDRRARTRGRTRRRSGQDAIGGRVHQGPFFTPTTRAHLPCGSVCTVRCWNSSSYACTSSWVCSARMPDMQIQPPGMTHRVSFLRFSRRGGKSTLARTTSYAPPRPWSSSRCTGPAAPSLPSSTTRCRSEIPLRLALVRVACTASSSMSMACNPLAPSIMAAIPSTPVPHPKSITCASFHVRRVPSNHSKHRRVVGCAPVPNAMAPSTRTTTSRG
mmetsp:Transcript_4244/g.15050  ORF Transcript_4244/g.15050 Transcript_4244/m.15050 type:complete len:238 (+) Transcript_4244:1340-2053(+)